MINDFEEIKKDSFKQLQELKEGMNNLFDRLLYLSKSNSSYEFIPAYDLIDKENEFILLMDLAGINIKDINIEAKNLTIKITGKREMPISTYKDSKIIIQELYYGPIKRNIVLPEKIIPSKVEAKYKNGILTLILPKLKTKSIKIDIE